MSNTLRNFTLFSVLLITAIVYYSGLNGPFLYDDLANLQALATLSQQYNFSNISLYLFQSDTGPLGRPVSFASFLINMNDWPDNPFGFKVINLTIHMVNGVLIYFLINFLLKNYQRNIPRTHIKAIAVAIAGLWLVHPLHVSATLYVIQRMTLLSAMFSLSTLIIFLRYQPNLTVSKELKDFLLPVFILFITISLAILSKENALLIFPIVLLFSRLYYANKTTLYKSWIIIFALVPTIIAIAYLILKIDSFSTGYAYKGFTLHERLLTQFRVVVDYLQQIIIPNTDAMTLFHDDFELSKSLISPAFTSISAIILFLLVMSTFLKINVIYRIAIAWFFIWHLLESSVIPLEIYFEHRNYLPSVGILLACVFAGYQLLLHQKFRLLKKVLPTVIFAIFAIQTFSLTNKWSNPDQLFTHWYENHPQSARTFLTLAQHIEQKDKRQAHRVIEQALESNRFANNLAVALKLYSIKCQLGLHDEHTILPTLRLSERQNNYSLAVLTMQASLAINILQNQCTPRSIKAIQQLLLNIHTIAPQAANRRWESDVQSKRAFIYLKYDDPDKALDLFIQSMGKGRHNELLAIIDLSIKLGKLAQARKWINIAKDGRFNIPVNTMRSINILESRLEAESLDSNSNNN